MFSPRKIKNTIQPSKPTNPNVPLLVGCGQRRARTSTTSPTRRTPSKYGSVVLSPGGSWCDSAIFRDIPDSFLAALDKDSSKRLKGIVETENQQTLGKSEELHASLSSGLSPEQLDISKWGLPKQVVSAYADVGITHMFPWQAECLSQNRVLNGENLVYSAPTSAGKTLVAEILLLKRVVETKKKGLFILPFVALAREKMLTLQRMFKSSGIRIDGYMGNLHPAGGMSQLDIAVCTIEKANSLINRMVDENRLHELGVIVVDELHMVGDSHRGYLIELLLTKVRYLNCIRMQLEDTQEGKLQNCIQIIGMSATLPNLCLISKWLDAALYSSDYRPVPLQEFIKVDGALFDKSWQKVRDVTQFPEITNDPDQVAALCFETVQAGHSVLVFCPAKNWCETLAKHISGQFHLLSESTREKFLQSDKLVDVLEQLRQTPAGLDETLLKTIPDGVAFHHAGLTIDERDVVEASFRKCYIKVLVATTTLSSGVNLPARRVIIRSPMFLNQLIDALTYHQMVGRAGRKGVDTEGESIIMVKEQEKRRVEALFAASLKAVCSCLTPVLLNGKLAPKPNLLRAILEIIVNGSAISYGDINKYISCTLFSVEMIDVITSSLASETVESLRSNQLIVVSPKNELIASQLGKAVVWSGLSPSEGYVVFRELEKARSQFNLENELHMLYLVTPLYLVEYVSGLDWYHYLTLWGKIAPAWKRVGNLVGVDDNVLANAVRGKMEKSSDAAVVTRVACMRRFYCALILNELVHEVSLPRVAEKYQCNKGVVQSLQQGASAYSGMVTVFCEELGWRNMALLFEQFQGRLMFGVQRELVELLRVQFLTARQARTLYNAGYPNLARLATAEHRQIQEVLRDSIPFVSNANDPLLAPKKSTAVLLNGLAALSDLEAAQVVISEAGRLLASDMAAQGLKFVTEKPAEPTHIDVSELKVSQEATSSHTGAEITEIRNTQIEIDAPLDAEMTVVEEIVRSQQVLIKDSDVDANANHDEAVHFPELSSSQDLDYALPSIEEFSLESSPAMFGTTRGVLSQINADGDYGIPDSSIFIQGHEELRETSLFTSDNDTCQGTPILFPISLTSAIKRKLTPDSMPCNRPFKKAHLQSNGDDMEMETKIDFDEETVVIPSSIPTSPSSRTARESLGALKPEETLAAQIASEDVIY